MFFRKLDLNILPIYEVYNGIIRRLRSLVREAFHTGYCIFHCDSVKHKVILN